MSRIFNTLVFPCGSEIGLEIYRSLRFSRHVHLVGASSVQDHGEFVYEDYIGNLPMVTDPEFETILAQIIIERKVDIFYPTMDSVIAKVAQIAHKLDCKVVGSPTSTALTCASKRKTYELLGCVMPIPEIYDSLEEIVSFPVFMKPNVGYGSRGAKKINDLDEAILHQKQMPDCIAMEYLPGNEFTVDCCTDSLGTLIFAKTRTRGRVMNGISVRSTNTIPVEIQDYCTRYAMAINLKIAFKGSWFFQVKEDAKGQLKLLEVGARLAGSSSLFRALGVNFALVNIWMALDAPVQLIENDYTVETDRALDIKYKLSLEYSSIYIDLDDTLILNNKINEHLVGFLFHAHNHGKKIILITRHAGDLESTLKHFRISEVFHEVIHLKNREPKAAYIHDERAIFIDDSFSERKEIFEKLKIPVFAPDAVEALW